MRKTKRKKINFKKLHENCDAMEASLYCVLLYSPPKDHSYKKIVDAYRRIAKVGLGMKI